MGAGGIAGQAYQAGVLAALEADLGWDARTADLIVGTSAGSITGTLLRGRVSARDLAAWTTRAPLSVEGHLLEDLFGHEYPEFEPFRLSHVLRRPALPGPALVRRLLLRPWQPPGVGLLLTLLAPGRTDISQFLRPLRAVESPGWQDGNLWICTVRRRDGRRVVFGRSGSPPASLHLAVSASCAIPGYFAPVTIDGIAYVDGGVHSPTNAAVLSRQDLDVVVVVSPMSGAQGVPADVAGVVRRHAGFRLGLELQALRAAGLNVLLFEPDTAVLAAMGNEWMSRERVDDITRAAFASARSKARDPEVRAALRLGGPDGSAQPIPPQSA
ncbi:MAG TPA: patatin-like phospholipase family protein [Acidimicrobiales bacterium]|nr:patatin-like phospholipase family protein [Acidimicrobiales bacterium]